MPEEGTYFLSPLRQRGKNVRKGHCRGHSRKEISMDEKKEITLDDLLGAVKALTEAQAETVKELKKFRETYEKHQKAGKF